ncbi:MAG TPA: DUF1939 domain-containing protein, partial [Saprospiraceae bacterium]|nr:DUF1939 domain-containing protein [Saprospiraceae bacterium]
VKTYIDNFTADKAAYPSDRFRCIIPLGGSSGNGAGDYYIKIASKTGDDQFDGKTYKLYANTGTTGWQGLVDSTETEPNGGGDCSQINNDIILGRNYVATVETKGTCNTDEFHLNLKASDFDATGDTLFIYLSNQDGQYSDHRIYGIWSTSTNSDIAGQLVYQTYTDFTMPSGQGAMNFESFNPNSSNVNTTHLAGDWDWPWFFYDYDQTQTSTQTVLTDWTKWLWNSVNIRGLRMDAVKHFPPSFVGGLLNDLHTSGIDPGLVVGEFYDGNPSLLKGWTDNVMNTMNAGAKAAIDVKIFDFALRQSLKDASDSYGYDVRNVFNSGIVDGASGSGFNVVTFVNNHDFRDLHQPVENDPMLAYAYILTNNKVGLPTVFYPDYYGVAVPNAPTEVLKPKIDELMALHKDYIYQATSVDYLSRFSTPYASNYLSANAQANTTLLYQISGGVGGKEVIVCINYSGDTLKVDHEINSTNGTTFGDYLGYSKYPIATVNAGNQIYIELPPRSYSVWIEDYVPLPLTLLDFSARESNGAALLNWATNQEVEVDGFEIERSFDGSHFEPIGFVEAKNEENADYTFIDQLNNKSNTKVYYRLKMKDLDGRFTYSKIQSVNLDFADTWKIRQNPIATNLLIDFQLAQKEKVHFLLTSITGQEMYSFDKQLAGGHELVELGVGDLPKGIYQIQITTKNKQTVSLLVK